MEAEDGDEDDLIALRYDFERSDYRILISLREDYLAPLEAFKAAMPSITQNRMRLARMTGAQALDAVMRPGGKLVTEEVAGAIVRFIAGGAELQNAEVEPSLLSLICRELNNTRIAQGKKEISPDLLAGSHASILSEFYARALADQPPGVHRFIEDQLLTEAGYRENLAEERVRKAFAEAGALPGALMQLVDRRLLRIEDRLDLRRVELTHDVLCNVVKAARDQRKERDARDAAQEQLRIQQARENATRKALSRSRQITSICLVLTVLAVGGAIFGYLKMRESQETKVLADTTRANAEKLVVFLLDDFYGKLVPIGQLELVDAMASHTLDYYRALPASARSVASDLNMSQALTSLASVRLRENKPEEAIRLSDEAVALLETKLARGEQTRDVRLHMASALVARARIDANAGGMLTAKAYLDRATALITDVGKDDAPSVAARRIYGEVYLFRGYARLRSNEPDGARSDLLASMAMLRPATDSVSMASYVEAGVWLNELFGVYGDFARAEEVATDASAVAAKVFLQVPGHARVARMSGMMDSNRVLLTAKRGQPGQALLLSEKTIQSSEANLRKHPGERGAIDDLVLEITLKSLVLVHLGQPRDALALKAAILTPYEKSAPSAYQSRNLISYLTNVAEIEGELGEEVQRVQSIAQMRRYENMVVGSEAADPRMSGALKINYASREAWLDFVAHGIDNPTAWAERLNSIGRAADAAIVAATTVGKEQLEVLALMQGTLETVDRLKAATAQAAGNPVEAESASRAALGHSRKTQPNIDDWDHTLEVQTEHALALARVNRLEEAAATVKEPINKHRAIITAGGDDGFVQVELARGLYVLALTKPTAGMPELKEAAALLAGLPAQMQAYRSIRILRETIAAKTWTGIGAASAMTAQRGKRNE